jgi:hypothetical protein
MNIMRTIKNRIYAIVILFVVLLSSCKNLDDMNVNPNGVDPDVAEPYLLMATVITYTGSEVVTLGFGDLAGVMQHTQKDGWATTHNAYEWSDQEWSDYYTTLRNAEEMYTKSESEGLDFYEGVALIFKAYNFGLITDLWGDAPFSEALQGENGNLQPVYDSQKDIYAGILSYLETANTLLSKDEYDDINSTQDLLYSGSVNSWQKLANSLALRYYMRISEKEPEVAQAGIEKIAQDQTTYPLILSASEDAGYEYVGNSNSDSWPTNLTFNSDSTVYRRFKMCSTLVDKLQELDDPRLAVWANKVKIPLVIDATKADDYDEIVDGKRIIAKNIADEFYANYGYELDTDSDYVGMPPSWSAVPQLWNLCPDEGQAPDNPHCSRLNDIYAESSNSLLKARLMSAAEVNFILSEAALKGWSIGGTAKDYYYAGIKASLTAWGVESSYDTYITNSGVVYKGTVEQIMEQKWIASWTAAAESWFDYRRTGYPALKPGKVVAEDALPIRFIYGDDELLYNAYNVQTAIDQLEETDYSADGKNSPWSKFWLLQDTGKPW